MAVFHHEKRKKKKRGHGVFKRRDGGVRGIGENWITSFLKSGQDALGERDWSRKRRKKGIGRET